MDNVWICNFSNSSLKKNSNLTIENTVDDGDIIFQSDNGSGGVETYLTIDGSASTIFNIQLEDSLDNGFIREEATVTRAAHIILEDELNSTGNFSILLEDGEQLLKEGSDTVNITTSTDVGGSILLEKTTLDAFLGQTSDVIGGILISRKKNNIRPFDRRSKISDSACC